MIFKKELFTFFLTFSILLSCSDDSTSEDNTPIAGTGTITISSIINDQIIDEPITITASIGGQNNQGNSVEVFIDSQSIYTAQNENTISMDFDPETQAAGPHKLKVVLTGSDGKAITKEIDFEIHRKLITINLPANMVNQYIINAVVFASKMDGGLITAKQFTNDDDTITLSSSEEFGIDEEFMLTFALTDNGSATGMSTHANLTRNNPETINLTKPFRGIEGETKTYPITGFSSNDFITSDNINEPYNSDYRVQLNASDGTFTVTMIDDVDVDLNIPDIFYMYGNNNGNYQYLTLYPPLPNDFVLDKSNFTTEGLESNSLILNSAGNFEKDSAFMIIYGYWTPKDFEINNFHRIYHRSQTVAPGDQLNYSLNTNFYEYRYWLTFDNYYVAGTGIPKSSYSIPDNTLDFNYENNKVDFDITGTDHTMGRIRLNNGGNFPIYVWDITFDSKSTTSIALPQLPAQMEESNLLSLYENNSLIVSSTELVSYKGIADYGEYLQKVIKDHKDPLQVTDGQELIYKGNVPFHDGPIKDFPFQ